MSKKRNPRTECYIKRENAKMVHICLHVAFFFAAAALLTFYFFDDFLMTQAVKPEYGMWLNAEVQSQLKFAFRCLGELFFVLAFSSLCIVFFYFADSIVSKMMKRVKNKFTKIPN